MTEASRKVAKVPPNLKVPPIQEGVATVDERGDLFLSDVFLQPSSVKVVYFQPNKMRFVVPPQQVIARGYLCEVSTTVESTLKLLLDATNQIILVISIESTLHPSVQTLLTKFQSLRYYDTVTVVGTLSHFSRNKPTDSVLSMLLDFGVSRIISSDEGERRFFHELKMIEANELRYKKMLQFSQGLKEAVHNSHDAVQVSNRDGSIMYTNKSFRTLNRLTSDECLGRSAVEVLNCLHDNGLKTVFLKKERHEEDYFIDKRMPTMKQRLSYLPVKNSRGDVVNHVSIQRIVEGDSPRPLRTSQTNCTSPDTPPISSGPLLRSSGSLGSIGSQPRINSMSDIPVASSVYIALSGIVKDPSCPPDIRESLEKCIETLRNESPQLKHTSRHDIIGGLLNERQYSTDNARVSVTSSHHHHHPHHASSRPPHMIQMCLNSIATWEFNILELERISNNSPLYYVGMEIFNEFQVADVLNVEESVIKSWLKLMEASYHRSNKYHNSTHAADVLQGTAYLVRKLQDSLKEKDEDPLDPLELASIFITAIIHDLDHPGRTNPFLLNSKHELAILYNDRAVLENHHVAFSFKVTLDNPQHNIYKALDNNTFRSLRSTLIDLVLATDMSKHFELLGKFKRYLISSQVDEAPVGSSTSLISQGNQENRMLMKRILVKCADISNASRPRELCREWASRVSEEYFSQTEEEKNRGLPVVFRDFDRETCKLPVTQVKFVDFFVLSLFEAWNNLCPIPTLVEQVASNYTFWKEQCNQSDLNSGEETDDHSSTDSKDKSS